MFLNTIDLNMEDLITGEKFTQILNNYNIYYHYELNTKFSVSDVIYTDTHRIDEIMKYLNKNTILITHNSDYNVGEYIADKIHVKKWFSQNVIYKKDNLIILPIGLENMRWFPEDKKHFKIITKRRKNKKPNKLLYINHNINTNVREREKPYAIFRDSHWATLVCKKNGEEFDQYLSDIEDHFFVLSPPGNGVDCHRTWETLYMNRIPIVKKSYHSQLFEDLPVVAVNEWEEITEKFLYHKLNEILHKNYNFEKLKFSYWKDLILKEI